MYFRPNEVTFVDFITNNVDETNLNTSGRNEMWDKVMPFYEDSKMIGSGTGRVQKFSIPKSLDSVGAANCIMIFL